MGIRTGKTIRGTEYATFRTPRSFEISRVEVRVYPQARGHAGPVVSVEGINGGNGTSVNKPAIPAENIDDLIRCLEWSKRRLAEMEAEAE